MRNVLVRFEVSVSQSQEHPLIVASPDYVFSCEYDIDDDKSFLVLGDLEYKVTQLVHNLKNLGCQVVALRKEVSHLDID